MGKQVLIVGAGLAGGVAARAILTVSLRRRESRGTFIRRDYPLEDDSNCLKNSVITRDETGDRWHLRFERVMNG